MKLYHILSLLLILCMSWDASATNRQSPRPRQMPRPLQNTAIQQTKLCPCSITETCECTANNQCIGNCVGAIKYRWVETNKDNQVALYKGDEQVGNYWYTEKEFKFIVGDRWIKGTCPTDEPKGRVKGMTCENGVCYPSNSDPQQYHVYNYPQQNYMIQPTRQRMSYGSVGCSSGS